MQLSKRVLQSVQVGARGAMALRVLGFDGRERARLVRAVMRRGSFILIDGLMVGGRIGF